MTCTVVIKEGAAAPEIGRGLKKVMNGDFWNAFELRAAQRKSPHP
jgi:hypothetical protein